MNKTPHPLTTLQEKMRREIEKTLKKYTGFDDLNDELYPGTEVFKDMFKLLSQAIATAYEQGANDREADIKKAFIEVYRGAGEVWFPYESEGNCTKEEELEAVEQEWEEIKELLIHTK